MPLINIFCDPGLSNQSVRADPTGATTVGSLTASSNSSSILGGTLAVAPGNCINGSFSTIVMGNNNNIFGDDNFISSGCNNRIGNTTSPGACTSTFSTIASGSDNFIDTNNILYSMYNVIAGGQCNYMGQRTSFSSILTGQCNSVCGQLSIIAGGVQNLIGTAAQYSFIGTGQDLKIDGPNFSGIITGGGNSILNDGSINSFIVSGQGNTVGSLLPTATSACYGIIVGGENNCIDSAINASTYGFIGSGFTNCIGAGTNYSTILSGSSNSIFGNCSSILGGTGNTSPAAFNYVGIFGQNITAVASDTLHIDNLWINPLTVKTFPGIAPPPFFPAGTVYADTTANNTLHVH